MTETSQEIVRTGDSVNTVMTAREKVTNLNSDVATIYSTIKTDSLAQKMELFAAITAAKPLADHLGQPINLIHVVAQVVEVGQEDGTMEEAVRTILIDEDGTAYSALSGGLLKSVDNLLSILGTPDTWGSAAIPIMVVEEKSRKGRRFFTVKPA